MWENFLIRTGHVLQCLQAHCQLWSMADITTHESRMDRRRIFKLGGETYHITTMYDRCSTSKGQRSRSQGHVTYQQQQRRDSAMDSHINFKLGENCHSECLLKLHAF